MLKEQRESIQLSTSPLRSRNFVLFFFINYLKTNRKYNFIFFIQSKSVRALPGADTDEPSLTASEQWS